MVSETPLPPFTCGRGSGGGGGGGAWAAARPGAATGRCGCCAAREHFRSSPASAARQCRSAPSQKGSHLPEPGLTWGAGPCFRKATGPPVPFLLGRWVGGDVVQSGPSKWLNWAIFGLESLLPDPQEVLSRHSQSHILGSLQRPNSGRAVSEPFSPGSRRALRGSPREHPRESGLELPGELGCVNLSGSVQTFALTGVNT